MTDEKKPPQEVGIEQICVAQFPARTQEHLLDALFRLELAFGQATRAARTSGELTLMHELEKRWDDYSAYLSVPLSRVPAKLFE